MLLCVNGPEVTLTMTLFLECDLNCLQFGSVEASADFLICAY